MRKLAAIFEVLGVLVVGWTATRLVAAGLHVPPLDETLDGFIEGPGSDFTRLTQIGFVTLLIQFLCLMVPAVLIRTLLHGKRLGDFGLTRGDRSIKGSVGLGAALFCVAGIPMKALLLANHYLPLGAPPSSWAIFQKDWNFSFWLFMAVGSYLVIPVFEEIFYRGYAQGRLAGELGFGGALFVAGLFTASHLQYMIADAFNVWMLASLFVLALAMAFSRQVTGSIAAAVVIHALMNVPLAHPYDAAALAAMLVAAVLLRARIRALTREFLRQLRGVAAPELLLLSALVCAFAAGMTLAPGPTILVLAALLLASLAVQIAAARRGPGPKARGSAAP